MEERKGIILAGGRGTRLYPMTTSINKQLLSVYDKPMIYYPLTTLMNAGIKDILIITVGEQLHHFIDLFDNGSKLGINIEYAIQNEPRGISDAFLIAHKAGFLTNDKCALALGDNIFYGDDFTKGLNDISNRNKSTIFGYRVSNPCEYGVVQFDHNNNVIGIDEKPDYPLSDYAVPGLYFYDDTVVERCKELELSPRGELEITDLNNTYIETGMNVELIKDSAAWFDTGNPDQMFEASMFVKSIQSRTGQMIGCIEETAFKNEFISQDEFWSLLETMPNSNYRDYMLHKYDLKSLV